MATGGGRIERGVTPASVEEWTVGSRVVGAVADAENIRLDLKSQTRIKTPRGHHLILICDSRSSPQYCSLCPNKPGAVGQTSVCGGLQPASARLPAKDVNPAAGGLKSAAG